MKPMLVVQGPIRSRSGYGEYTRGIIRHILALDQYEVVLVDLPWGSTPLTALTPGVAADDALLSRIVTIPVQLPRIPEVFVQISVPNEFQPMGKFNIGITAGIETNACSIEWLEGCNRMDVIWTMSQHSKLVFQETKIEQKNPQGQIVRLVKLEKPIDILPMAINLSTFHVREPAEIPKTINTVMKNVTEKFAFLFVGHWLKGNVGEDRKNVGLLVKIFCEVFKHTPTHLQPALILKTSGATFSLMDRDDQLSKLHQIRASAGPTAPNVYLLHGEMTDDEMSGLYNHPKVKVHINLTKGEGHCAPLLEATTSKKPIIASGWSGHLDFLNPNDAILLQGELKPVDASAVWAGVIIPESSWFNVDHNAAAGAMVHVMKYYDKFLPGAENLYKNTKTNWSYDAVREKVKALFATYVPTYNMIAPLSLPKLRKIGATAP